MTAQRQPLAVVAGPTASGKTALAVALAKVLNGEVVSADSMQVYKDIPVATAAPSFDERDGIPHHLIGHVSLSESYSVARYAEEARRVIDEIAQRGRLPILCGGTGLYIAAVTDNIRYGEQDEEKVKAIRARLQEEAALKGDQAMWDTLHTFDPTLADKLHIHDRGRVLRAIEMYELTGVPMSEWHQRQKAEPSPYDVKMLVLDFKDRARLYDRIDRRVDGMLKNGLLEETAAVLRLESPTAEQAIGCKELRPYFDAECSLHEALEVMKRRSRQYAKRQMSWFRRLTTAHVLYVDDYADFDLLVEAASAFIQTD
ncbi:MAG: tRNA (adenosine(37)-N6)-dimethylallyltransferase MiaA [Clostridia bacterium]|nr:tRNA (adenosine(37)-N6)-dimethylallyltransferase MiaA [Clostridia bacterium]